MNKAYDVLENNEKIIYALRSLYTGHGYLLYKMSKFEEYDFYSKNKDFLISDSIITFTDTNGKLMALKPDVTLSIIKNRGDLKSGVQKLCYNENVYRLSKGTGSFRELMQAGLECIGDIDDFCIGEVLLLAAESLRMISEDFVLDISSLDLLGALIDKITDSGSIKQALMKCIGDKNIHGITEICRANGIDETLAAPLCELVTTYGKAADVLPKIEAAAQKAGAEDAVDSLKRAISIFENYEFFDNIRIDMSVVSDMKYYNGIVFNGFISNIPDCVLSGGQYDKLMNKLKSKSRAIGFAVYLDEIENLDKDSNRNIDVLLVYDETSTPSQIRNCAEKLIAEGKKVFASGSIPDGLKYRQKMQIKNGEVTVIEDNA